ncbi:MAG: hypothetical protein QOE39_4330 [Bradyrhizobium sp.]|nr:hypothetical protein [Bradyrhizobium sp.]
MISDVMVWLDGGVSDEIRLAAVADISRRLQPKVIIGLFLNPLPLPGPVEGDATEELIDSAREAGDEIEKLLKMGLRQLERPVEIRRFDVLADDIAKVAAREARFADTFVALRPNGAMDPDQLVEGVLLGSGRHLFLVPETERPKIDFSRILISWNGSREAARALSESIPFLSLADEVTVVVVTSEHPTLRRGHPRCRCRQSSPASRDPRCAASRQEQQQRSRNQVDGGGRTAQGRPHRYGWIRSFAPA